MLDELAARGLFQECTDRNGLGELLAKSAPVSVYAGYDPTSPSLHVGSLVPVILLRRFQLAGHRPVIVVGGATGMIGDPSGKSAERNLLDEATLAANVAGIHAQLSRFLEVDSSPTGAVVTNNYEWTKGVTFLEFLRDYGKYLTVNYMTAKDSVASRLGGDTGISYTEFSYMLLQAFDFVHLSRSLGCRVQVGGSDQYGSITAGCELRREMGGPVPTHDVPRSELEAGIAFVDLLVRVGLATSKGDARRAVEQGGAYLNDVVVKDVAMKVTLGDLLTETRMVLRKGKKNLRIVHAI